MNWIFHDDILTLLIYFLSVADRILEKWQQYYLLSHMLLSQYDFDIPAIEIRVFVLSSWIWETHN